MEKYQYNHKRRKIIKVIFTSLILVLLMVLTNTNPKINTYGENAFGAILSPLTKVFYFTSSKTSEMFNSVFGTFSVRHERDQLMEENKILKEKLLLIEDVLGKEEFLKKEYDLMTNTKYNLQTAYISGKEPGNFFVRFIIDKGSLSGVKVGDIIVQGVANESNQIVEGIVGKVTQVGLNWSKVSSIQDETESVSFKAIRNQENGVITSQTEKGLTGYMFSNSSDVKVGDEVMTSGLGGVYPRDIYIGKIIEVTVSEGDLVKHVVIQTPIEFTKIYRVLVLRTEEGQYE